MLQRPIISLNSCLGREAVTTKGTIRTRDPGYVVVVVVVVVVIE